jgi:hypothetical protein
MKVKNVLRLSNATMGVRAVSNCERNVSGRSETKYSQSQMRSELAFKLFNRVGPLERLGGLIVVSNEVEDDPLKLTKVGKMVRLQEFALEHTKPDFDLIQPGIVCRNTWLLRNFADAKRGILRDYGVFHAVRPAEKETPPCSACKTSRV